MRLGIRVMPAINSEERIGNSRDDWRYDYVGADTWRLDLGSYNPEDDMIEAMDEEKVGTMIPTIDALDVLNCLPKKQAEIIRLHIWEGWSFQQIADKKFVSKQAIHQQYQKALKTIKKKYPLLPLQLS